SPGLRSFCLLPRHLETRLPLSRRRRRPLQRKAIRAFFLALLLASACSRVQVAKTADDALGEVDPPDDPGFADDLSFEGWNEALAHSLDYVKRVTKWAPDRTVTFGRERVPLMKVGETIEKLQALIATNPSPTEFKAALRRDFRVFRSTGGDREGTVLFT